MATFVRDSAVTDSLTFSFAQRVITIRIPQVEKHPILFELVQRNFGPSELLASEPDVSLELCRGESPPTFEGPEIILPGVDPQRMMEDREQLRRRGAGEWQIQSPRHTIEWSDSFGRLTLEPTKSTGLSRSLLGAMLVVSKNIDSLPIHSALIGYQRKFCLLLGGNGQGKSTTVGIASAMGFDVGSDDTSFLYSSETAIQVRGAGRSLMLPVEHTTGHEEQALDARGRVTVSDLELTQRWHPLAGLILVEHGSKGETTVDELPGREAIHRLMGALATRIFCTGDELTAVAQRLVRVVTLPRYRLLMGADPDVRERSTQAALTEIFDA